MKVLFIACFFALVCVTAFAEYNSDSVNYVDVLSANDFGYLDDGAGSSSMRFCTTNKIALNLKWFGVSGEYQYQWVRDGRSTDPYSHNEHAIGIGAGLPHPEWFRLFATYHSFRHDRDWWYGMEEGSRFSLEAAKRFYSLNMCSELSARFSTYDYSDNYYNYPNLVPNILAAPALTNGSPKQDIEIKAFVSSVTNSLLEPVTGLGLAPDEYPLLLVNDAAFALYTKFRHTSSEESEHIDSQEINQFKALLSMNLSQYFGLDLSYKYHQVKENYDLAKHNQASLLLRPVVVAYDAIRVTGLTEIGLHRTNYVDEWTRTDYNLDFGAIVSLNVKNHLSLYGRYLNRNWWDLGNDPSSFGHDEFIINAGAVLRF